MTEPTYTLDANGEALHSDATATKDAMDQLTDFEIDVGAKALREFQMSGRFTVEWEKLPKSQKRKWLFAAAKVLVAAKGAGR